MNDSLALFGGMSVLEPIPMPDADVGFIEGFYRTPLSQQLKTALLEETRWRQENVVLWNQSYPQPRLSAWYGDAGSRYRFSGLTLEPHAWTDTLLHIKTDIECVTGNVFNSVLLNLYRDERDSVGWHSDDEAVFGDQPVIASLSLGETRIFKLKHKTRKDLKTISIALTNGSLLVMAGTTQRFWRHAVGKERAPKEPRINLTFRNIVAPTP